VSERRKSPRRPAYVDSPTIPISYLQLLIEILAEHGFEASLLLEGARVPRSVLEQPRVSARQWARLMGRAQELTGHGGLGYEFGLRMRPTVHGLVGYAAMSANSIRDATEITLRYATVRQAYFELAMEERGERCLLTVRERFPIPAMRTYFIESILCGIARGFAMLLGRELTDFPEAEMCFDTPEPPYYARWRDQLCRVRFGCPFNGLRFPASYLGLRPAFADPYASLQARALCEQELSFAREAGMDLPARVIAELRATASDGYPALETVAARLFLSTRTLKRRLQEHGTSFLKLLGETRMRDACDLLSRTELSVQAVAARLGYENPANFSRAFAHTVGEPPSSYRARIKAKL
jgi:AraC-like DNA-binding protein